MAPVSLEEGVRNGFVKQLLLTIYQRDYCLWAKKDSETKTMAVQSLKGVAGEPRHWSAVGLEAAEDEWSESKLLAR